MTSRQLGYIGDAASSSSGIGGVPTPGISAVNIASASAQKLSSTGEYWASDGADGVQKLSARTIQNIHDASPSAQRLGDGRLWVGNPFGDVQPTGTVRIFDNIIDNSNEQLRIRSAGGTGGGWARTTIGRDTSSQQQLGAIEGNWAALRVFSGGSGLPSRALLIGAAQALHLSNAADGAELHTTGDVAMRAGMSFTDDGAAAGFTQNSGAELLRLNAVDQRLETPSLSVGTTTLSDPPNASVVEPAVGFYRYIEYPSPIFVGSNDSGQTALVKIMRFGNHIVMQSHVEYTGNASSFTNMALRVPNWAEDIPSTNASGAVVGQTSGNDSTARMCAWVLTSTGIDPGYRQLYLYSSLDKNALYFPSANFEYPDAVFQWMM